MSTEPEQGPTPASPSVPSVLTVTEQIYHQHEGGQPTAVAHRWTRRLAGDGHPYTRPGLKVTGEWKPLDCGWVADVGALVLSNEEGTNLQAVPTPEERAALAARRVEVGVAHQIGRPRIDEVVEPVLVVRPGESARFEPADPGALRVRCRAGAARVTLHLYPA